MLVASVVGMALGGMVPWLGTPAFGQEICRGFGPQAPRDIASPDGTNLNVFSLAPDPGSLNLCNIHAHRHAEHKGPGFAVFAGAGTGAGEDSGYRCNETAELTPAELVDETPGHGAFRGVAPGDTIEVHWVFSSCDVGPGHTLRACSSDACANPQLRVESQVFLLVNDPNALDFSDYDYAGTIVNGRRQPKALPTGSGEPVVYGGSTTGPEFSASTCSPLQVTWSVRPTCAKLDIASLHAWASEGNAFEEVHVQGVRPLVSEPLLLAPID